MQARQSLLNRFFLLPHGQSPGVCMSRPLDFFFKIFQFCRIGPHHSMRHGPKRSTKQLCPPSHHHRPVSNTLVLMPTLHLSKELWVHDSPLQVYKADKQKQQSWSHVCLLHCRGHSCLHKALA